MYRHSKYMDTSLNVRTTKERLSTWRAAATEQGYTSFSEFLRVALTEKAAQTPYQVHRAVLTGMEAANDG